MSKTLKVDFNARILDVHGADIVEQADLNDVGVALVRAGVSRENLPGALTAVRPYVLKGGEEPEKKVLTVAAAATLALQQVEKGVGGADRVDRMRLLFKALDTNQPAEITEKEKETLLKAIEQAYPNSALVYFRVHEILNQTKGE